MEVIPAILESSWPEVEKKIKLVDGLTDWIQLDVSDGCFTPYATWNNPGDFLSLNIKSKLEVHLMVNDPLSVLNDWLINPIGRIVIHVEALEDVQHPMLHIDKEMVLGFRIETPWEPYRELIQSVGRVLFLSVQPGRQGQEFDRWVLDKVISLKDQHPDVVVEVDGGINPAVISDLKSAGADAVVVGSYIFSSSSPAQAIGELLER